MMKNDNFISPTVIEASSYLSEISKLKEELFRCKKELSKYKKDDKNRRQSRKD
mgnify:FL=1